MKKKENMPSWAYWGLWGINTRKTAMLLVSLSLILALIIVPIGIMISDFTLILISLVPVWYWLSLKWADNNSAWQTSEDQK